MPEEGVHVTVPQTVYDFIDDPKRLEEVDVVIKKHGLADSRQTQEAVDPVLNLVVGGDLKLDAIPARFQEKLNLTPEAAMALTMDFANLLLVPLRTFFPEVDKTLTTWGITATEPTKPSVATGDSGPTPELKTSVGALPVQKVSANAFVHGELERYGLELPEEHLQKKFERILSELVAKRKTKEETLDLLTRPRKVGGLELDPNASAQLLNGLLEDSKHVPQAKAESDVFSQDTGDHALQRSVPPAPSAAGPRPQQGGGPSPARLRELPAKKTPDSPLPQTPKPKPLPPRTIVKIDAVPIPQSPLPSRVQSPQPAPVKFDPATIHPDDEDEIKAHKENVPNVEPLHDLEAMTQKTMKAITASQNLDAEGSKKLHAIVKTRLKGLRDAYKTRFALEAATGLGLSGAALTQALEAIEQTYELLEAAGIEKAQREKREHVAKRAARFVSNLEQGEMDSGVSMQDTGGRALLRSAPPAPSAAGQRFQKSAGPSPARLRELPASEKPEPSLPINNEPPGSRPPAPGPLKRKGKMRDIVAPRKLSGPVEELGFMTVADFRRLGSTAEVAAEEVSERLKLLEEQSYGMRLQGIAAWRKSPLYETYVSVVSEAMQSREGMETVLRAHKSSGEEMLTLPEVRALIKLNGTLRV